VYWVQWVTYCVPSAALLARVDHFEISPLSRATPVAGSPLVVGCDGTTAGIDLDSGSQNWTGDGRRRASVRLPFHRSCRIRQSSSPMASARRRVNPAPGSNSRRAIPSATGPDRRHVRYEDGRLQTPTGLGRLSSASLRQQARPVDLLRSRLSPPVLGRPVQQPVGFRRRERRLLAVERTAGGYVAPELLDQVGGRATDVVRSCPRRPTARPRPRPGSCTRRGTGSTTGESRRR